jgi:hypothetical protein
MSSKHLPLALVASLPLAGCLGLSGCGASEDLAASQGDWTGDASFGNPAEEPDAGAGDGDSGDGDGDGDGPTVRLRLLHGLINLPSLTVCYDPDLEADVPDTAVDEGRDGAAAPQFLGLTGVFGTDTGFVELAPKSRGALTLHRPPPLGPAPSDAGAADQDGGASDAGTDAPPGIEDLCNPETRELVMPLPYDGRWLDPDAPLALEAHGIASTLAAGATITLLASGVALDEAAMLARTNSVRDAYLAVHPGDSAGADAAAALTQARLEAELGPRVVPSLHQASQARPFALSFAHLVPDVPASSDGEQPAAEPRSGALRLCTMLDDIEQPALPGPTAAGLPFRARVEVALPETTALRYTFRVFAADAFDLEAKDCAGTSLSPVAELTLSATQMQPGRSYTLAAVGAIAPDELCTPSEQDSLARAGCPAAAEELKARLVLLKDD